MPEPPKEQSLAVLAETATQNPTAASKRAHPSTNNDGNSAYNRTPAQGAAAAVPPPLVNVGRITTTAPPWELLPQESWSRLSNITDAEWKANYLLLAQFRKEHGHLHVSDGVNAPLNLWLKRQQQMYKDFYSQFEGKHSPTARKSSEEMRVVFEKIEMLRIMGFVFVGKQRRFVAPEEPEKLPTPADDINRHVGSSLSTKRKMDWETNLDILREFRDKHGHCDPEEVNLNRWVYRQRKRLKGECASRAAPLSDDEVRRLRDVGVLTLTKKNLKRLARSDGIAPPGVAASPVPGNLSNPEKFDEMYEKMKQFYEKHGHTIVPEKEDGKLRGFLVDVRKEYKKIKAGETSPYLTPIRIERLEQINFSFEARARHSFDERVDQWVEFRKQSGGKDPRSSSTLGKWVSKTRVRYHDTRDGKVPDYITKEQHHLTEEQIDKLRRLGFDFGERDYSRVVRSWDERFEDLLAFREEHGHVDVPQRHPELGEWVHHQRSRRKTMPQDKADKLEQIGFKWLTRAPPSRKKSNNEDGEASTDEEDEPSPQRVPPPPPPPQHYHPVHSPQRQYMGFGTPTGHWF